MMRTFGTCILLTVLLGGVSRVAFADDSIPAACAGPRESRGYRGGEMAGKSLIRSAWRSVRDCDRMETFEDIVTRTLDRYSLPASATPYSVCRYSGMVNGMLDQLDEQFLECQAQCFEEGRISGEIAAIAYCELSIALGGLSTADDFIRMPVRMCGLNFEIGCDLEFMDVTLLYANPGGTCEPYTRDRYYEVWDQTRHNQCAYEPELEASDESESL